MNVTSNAAPADRALIEEMLQDYLHELSTYSQDLTSINGRYRYPYLGHYWWDPNRHPFLLKNATAVVGFLLIRTDTDPADGTAITEIAEIYIKPEARRQGFAGIAVVEAFRKFPGAWRIAVLAGNQSAYKFWHRLISQSDPAFSEQTTSQGMSDYNLFTLTT